MDTPSPPPPHKTLTKISELTVIRHTRCKKLQSITVAEPPSPPLFFKYHMERKNEMKSAKRNPYTFIHMNPLSRNPGPAPVLFKFSGGGGGGIFSQAYIFKMASIKR